MRFWKRTGNEIRPRWETSRAKSPMFVSDSQFRVYLCARSAGSGFMTAVIVRQLDNANHLKTGALPARRTFSFQRKQLRCF